MPRIRYHHLGIPTDRELPEEDYIAGFKLYASGYEESPYGVEWMKFDPDCSVPELVRTVPHVAFVVEDLKAAIAGQEILVPPNSPSEGVTVAFIVDNGACMAKACTATLLMELTCLRQPDLSALQRVKTAVNVISMAAAVTA